MRQFNLERAKAGEKVKTLDGRDARIICFDADNEYPIIALVREDGKEHVYTYTNYGSALRMQMTGADLMMEEE